MMTLNEAAKAMNGTISADAMALGSGVFQSVSTDSRQVQSGTLFFALSGERFDAHDFLAEVARSGACAAVVKASKYGDLPKLDMPLVLVDDPRLALGRLAKAWRQRFTLPVIAVTGSNGKTTCKEMIAGILRAQAELEGLDASAVLATQGNLNNDIGLPLTLLGLRDSHRFSVLELGMNHPGEIAYLADIACPTAALVINALRAHLEGMGSLEGVAREKGSLFEHLSSKGVAVMSGDSEFLGLWKRQAGHHDVKTFSLEAPADVTGRAVLEPLGSHISLTAESGVAHFYLQAPGQHNAHNATAAAAVCLAAGCAWRAVEKGLAAFSGVKGRLQRKSGLDGALLIDDTYNANPDSVRAAIDVLSGLRDAKLRVLVLGDMGEIGASALACHQEVGEYAREKGVHRLLALGEMSRQAVAAFGAGAQHCSTVDEVVDATQALLNKDTAVLVKGSRFMRMERIVARLESGVPTTPQGAATCC